MRLFLVVNDDPFGAGHLDADAVRRFSRIKGRTLGYESASYRILLGPDTYRLAAAEPGAVASREDADRLIEALAVEFPGVSFRAIPHHRPDAEEVVWHGP